MNHGPKNRGTVEPSLVIIRRLVPTKKQGEQFLQRWTGRSTLGNKLIRSGGEVPSSFNSVPRHLGKNTGEIMTAILPRDGTIINAYIHSIISTGHLDAFTQLICWVQDTSKQVWNSLEPGAFPTPYRGLTKETIQSYTYTYVDTN